MKPSAWVPVKEIGSVTTSDAQRHDLPLFGSSLSVVSWGFNEEELIGGFVDRMMALLESSVEDYELIVVDDGSSDRTPEILAEAAAKYPHLRVITHPQNRGIGEALASAMAAAQKDYFVWQTVDWSYDISRFRQFLELLGGYDVVAGVRLGPVEANGPLQKAWAFLKHLPSRSDTLSKALVSLANYSIVRFLFNFPMSDYQNVVFYPTKLVKSLGMEARSSFANPELLMKAYWRGASIIEVPIGFCPRQKGEAKGTRPGSILKSVSDIVALWFNWVIRERLPYQGDRGQIRRLVASEWYPQEPTEH